MVFPFGDVYFHLMRGRGERLALGLASITPGLTLTSDLVEELARVLGERVVMSYSSPKG